MVIKESEVNFTIKERCHALDENRSSYYKWLKTKPKEADDMEIEVLKVYDKYRGTYGRPRITQQLKNSGIVINHKKVHRIMRKLDIKAIIRRKYCVRKYKKEYVVPNLLNREFKSDKPLTKLVCDVSELKRMNNKRYYLCSVMDLFNNEIIASNISSNNDWDLVSKMLSRLKINNEMNDKKIILHTDQGSQFTSYPYKKMTTEKNLILSMSRVGNCYDNAAKESFFGHFKEEFYIYYNPKTEKELHENIEEFIRYYNYERIQMCFKMSPILYMETQSVLTT
jgi:transposase InsO family protein